MSVFLGNLLAFWRTFRYLKRYMSMDAKDLLIEQLKSQLAEFQSQLSAATEQFQEQLQEKDALIASLEQQVKRLMITVRGSRQELSNAEASNVSTIQWTGRMHVVEAYQVVCQYGHCAERSIYSWSAHLPSTEAWGDFGESCGLCDCPRFAPVHCTFDVREVDSVSRSPWRSVPARPNWPKSICRSRTSSTLERLPNSELPRWASVWQISSRWLRGGREPRNRPSGSLDKASVFVLTYGDERLADEVAICQIWIDQDIEEYAIIGIGRGD